MTDETAELGSRRQRSGARYYYGVECLKFLADYGPYSIRHLSQDEAIAYFPQGSLRGIWAAGEDSQSDVSPPSTGSTADMRKAGLFLAALRQQLKNSWTSADAPAVEEPEWGMTSEGRTISQDADTGYDIPQWPSDRLAAEILGSQVESDMSRLRTMILAAEDTAFSIDQSARLAPWLLGFAERRRDSNDPQDEAAVWSAVRTGASMLSPHDADRLRPLLEPGHPIETSLVTLKMLGRIFEAQPPTDIDQHAELAAEARQIANGCISSQAAQAAWFLGALGLDGGISCRSSTSF